MPLVHLVIGLALVEFLLFGLAVARARTRYNVPAPAMGGHEVFERYFRVHMNTLEQLVIFIPALLVFSRYVNAYAGAALGVLFILGRLLYFTGYVQAPDKRHAGFVLTAIANVTLLLGAIIGSIRAWLLQG
jgi:glutathione S-transferase